MTPNTQTTDTDFFTPSTSDAPETPTTPLTSPTTSGRHAKNVVLRARNLEASARHGRIFGPLDLDLGHGELCVVDGRTGAGKSTLMLALSGRFRRTRGELTIAGVDALANPYEAMQHAAVAQLDNYVVLEDSLTVAESITERAYLDKISTREAEARFAALEEHQGYRLNRKARIEELPALARLAFSIALVSLKPAAVIVADDVDASIPSDELAEMYAMLEHFAAFDGSALIVSVTDTTELPTSVQQIHLEGGRTASSSDFVTPIEQKGTHA